ncbi:hypothetical protein [Thermostichus sp. OS-CIW-28]
MVEAEKCREPEKPVCSQDLPLIISAWIHRSAHSERFGLEFFCSLESRSQLAAKRVEPPKSIDYNKPKAWVLLSLSESLAGEDPGSAPTSKLHFNGHCT